MIAAATFAAATLAAASPVRVGHSAAEWGFALLSHKEEAIAAGESGHLALQFATGPGSNPPLQLHVAIGCAAGAPSPCGGPGALPRHAITPGGDRSTQTVSVNSFGCSGAFSLQVFAIDPSDRTVMVSAAHYNVTFTPLPEPPPPPPHHERVLGAAAAALGLAGTQSPPVITGFLTIEQTLASKLQQADTAEAGYALVDQHSSEVRIAGGGGSGGVTGLARRLCVWGDDEHNYRAIYGWVATHIEYDKLLFERLEAGSATDAGDRAAAAAVLESGTAVCAGFARLTVELAFWCELEAVEVSGWAKGPKQQIGAASAEQVGHAWVAVKLHQKWHLSDPTWAASDLDDGDAAQQPVPDELMATPTENEARTETETGAKPNPGSGGGGAGSVHVSSRQKGDHFRYYFTPSPAELLFDHLPREPFWRLLLPSADDAASAPATTAETADAAVVGLSHDEWDRLPLVKPAFFTAGLAPASSTALEYTQAPGGTVVSQCSDVGAEGWWAASASWLGRLFGRRASHYCVSLVRSTIATCDTSSCAL
jgi:hypothetical protein